MQLIYVNQRLFKLYVSRCIRNIVHMLLLYNIANVIDICYCLNYIRKDCLYTIVYIRLLIKDCTSQRLFIANVVDIFMNKF